MSSSARLVAVVRRTALCIPFVLGILAISASARAETPEEFARWDEAIIRFEQLDRQNPPQPGGVLFLGSSSIRLWDLDEFFPEANAVNRGFGGSQIADSVYFFDRIVVPHQPNTIVFYAGDNDIAKDKPPCRVADDFEQFVAAAKTMNPDIRVLFIAIKPSIARWELIHRIRAANALIRMHCEEDPQLTYIDIESPMLGDDGKPREELFVDDGLHLNEQGYTVWAEVIRPHLGLHGE